jgi:hypothetical protein
MGTVHVTLAYSKARTVGGAQLPVYLSTEAVADTVTTSSSSVQSDIVITQAHIDNGAMWRIKPLDSNVFAKTGPNPEAGPNTGWAEAAGGTLDIAATEVGEKLALKDA